MIKTEEICNKSVQVLKGVNLEITREVFELSERI